ncbi:MAG: hypothetical protein ACI4KH_03960 [Oscillospiraceae bacterium]
METRTAKIICSKAGGTAGKNAVSYKISLPTSWINSLGLDEKNREVELRFDGQTISIGKKQTSDSYIKLHKQMGHKIKKYSYFDDEKLCTVIYADHTDKSVFAENFTDNLVKTAFGKNKFPAWEDFCTFIEERCVPKDRNGLREYLECLGLDEYEPFSIIMKTKGKMAEDSQWIEVEEI